MALVFPLSWEAFGARLPVVTAPFVLQEQHQLSGLGTGDVLAAHLAPSRWTAQVTLVSMPVLEARAVQALIESLDGPINSFYFCCPDNWYPAEDPGGVVLGASVVTIHAVGANNRSLRLGGLPAGYKLSVGDAVAFDYGSNPVRRAWHRVAEPAVADGAGVTPLFDLSHHLRPGVTAGLTVSLKKPAAKMFVWPKSLSLTPSLEGHAVTFQAVQRP